MRILRWCLGRLNVRCSSSSSTGTVLSPALQALRNRQHNALKTLENLLAKIGAEERHTAVLKDAMSTAVFLVCTVGEFNAGKSSLLNALLSGPFCRVGVLPTTAAITLLRHPETVAAPVTAGGVVMIDVPIPWLRDVSVVDTPGTNTLDASHTALTQEYLPRADLLLFVTSADRPFSESEQLFLRAIRSWGKKVVFVVNKADILGGTDELEQVTDYVARHGANELGELVPVLPVAAKTALRLKERAAAAGGCGADDETPELGVPLAAHAEDAAEALAASQWHAFEERVLHVIGSDERAAAKLQSQLSLASAVLGTYEQRQQREMQTIAADVETIAEARRQLGVWEKETLGELDAQRARVRVVLHGLHTRGNDFLQEELQIWALPRLLSRADFVQRFHQVVLAETTDDLQSVVAAAAAWMDSKGAAQAGATSKLLRARLQRAAHTVAAEEEALAAARGGVAAPSAGSDGSASFAAQRQVLLLKLQASAAKAMSHFDPDQASQRMVSAAQTSLAGAAVLTSGAAGLSGLVAVKAVALFDLSGLLPAALLAGVGLGVLPMQRYRLQREYRERIDVLESTLDTAVHAHLKAELHSAKDRAACLITPFATLVGSASARQEEGQRALKASRTELEELARELARASSGHGGW